MKKVLLVLTLGCILSLSACGNSDSNGNEPGTGVAAPDVTMTAPDEAGKTASGSVSDTASQRVGVPGSDNPRKNDIDGQPYQPGPTPDSVKRNNRR